MFYEANSFDYDMNDHDHDQSHDYEPDLAMEECTPDIVETHSLPIEKEWNKENDHEQQMIVENGPDASSKITQKSPITPVNEKNIENIETAVTEDSPVASVNEELPVTPRNEKDMEGMETVITEDSLVTPRNEKRMETTNIPSSSASSSSKTFKEVTPSIDTETELTTPKQKQINTSESTPKKPSESIIASSQLKSNNEVEEESIKKTTPESSSHSSPKPSLKADQDRKISKNYQESVSSFKNIIMDEDDSVANVNIQRMISTFSFS